MAKDYDEAAAADMAARMGKNATEADIENVANKMDSMNKGPLAKVWDKVTQLWEAFKSPETPASLKAIIIGGLIYMVSPVDLIPDVIPVAGLLDDVGVIGLVFSQFLRLTSAAAVGAAIGFTINIVVKGVLTLKKLIEELKKRELENVIGAKFESKDYKTVKVGLYDADDNKVGAATVEADSISDELYEGKEIQLYD